MKMIIELDDNKPIDVTKMQLLLNAEGIILAIKSFMDDDMVDEASKDILYELLTSSIDGFTDEILTS